MPMTGLMVRASDGSGKVSGHACRADEDRGAFGFFFADKALGTLGRAVARN